VNPVPRSRESMARRTAARKKKETRGMYVANDEDVSAKVDSVAAAVVVVVDQGRVWISR
jgi:hypothetical protein